MEGTNEHYCPVCGRLRVAERWTLDGTYWICPQVADVPSSLQRLNNPDDYDHYNRSHLFVPAPHYRPWAPLPVAGGAFAHRKTGARRPSARTARA